MMKLLKNTLTLFILTLTACQGVSVKDVADELELERSIPETSSIIPVDETSQDSSRDSRVLQKALTYVSQSYSHSTSRHYDSYGLLLPTEETTFVEQGDALGWNMMALEAMCMLTKGSQSTNFSDLTTDISQLWSDIKTNLILSDGHLIRHPESTSNTSISKDHMALFMSSLAMIYDLDCEPVKSDATTYISDFIDYGIDNDWEMGESGKTDPTTTLLVGRHPLYDLNNLYDIGYSEDDLDLSTSAETTTFNTTVADYINENKYYCRQGYPGACLRILNAGVFGNHLHFQTSVQFFIGSKHLSDSVYSTSKSSTFLSNMAKVGDSIGFNNWLFVAGYRHFTMTNPTYNDILKHLDEDWPENLPSESVGVTDWGCTDFVWQRFPDESCSGSNKEYVGTDFLLLYAYTQL